ncbi:MAG: DUF1801 domain-containing protein [Myxococcaceae bacterium]
MAAKKPSPIEAFFAKAPAAQRDELLAVDALIRKVAPKLERKLWSNGTLLGYGEFHYRYATGREGDWPLLALSARKANLSLYVCSLTEDGTYVAEAHADELAPASVGKSCIRFKSLEDLDRAALTKVLKLAVRNGGAFGA